MRGKIAPLLVVLLFLPIHHVIGSCTTAQKDAILEHCEEYIKLPYYPVIIPSYIGVCCDKVRDVPGRDMECIVSLLTHAEKARHSEKKIKGLRPFCPYHSPPPPRRQSR
ncbi:hypothetical protein SEVIR_8G077200v4 [Setaria viridis]|uniref:Bifunctional inhibitor/plant lipid transfer protein/seed storage helical domain-containing protein n=2 Tax=Setaria TaxID=4554 RepID=K3ZKF1_SETIT|nr:hypothetical protein SETIT_8G076200v2 [Setaria italica]TKV99943.1 hypothetical protein SEVIR_8G077200v2 [Setaria viridis]